MLNLGIPDLVILARCLDTVNAKFEDARFLVFSARCVAASENAEFVVSYHYDCQVCQCQCC